MALQEIAALALDHPRQTRARGINMRHHVPRPGAFPILVGGRGGVVRRCAAVDDSGVGAEERDGPNARLGLLDDADDVGLLRYVTGISDAADRLCHGLSAIAVDVGADHALGALAVEALAQGLADAVGAAGDHHDLIAHLHAWLPLNPSSRQSCPWPCVPPAGRSLRPPWRVGSARKFPA